MPRNQSDPIIADTLLEGLTEFLTSLNIQQNSKYFRQKNG
jgi:hypothetical protein